MGSRTRSSPTAEDDLLRDGKRKQGERRNLEGEQPTLKRFKHDDDNVDHESSDEDRRRHRSRRDEGRDGDRRTRRNGSYSPSPDRKHSDGDGGRWEFRRTDQNGRLTPPKHRDRNRYDDSRFSDRDDRVSGRDDERVSGRDARVSGRDDRGSGRDGRFSGRDGRVSNSGARVSGKDARGIDARISDRDGGDRDDGASHRDGKQRQGEGRNPNLKERWNHEEDHDSSGDERNKRRSRDKGDGDHRKNSRKHENDRSHDPHHDDVRQRRHGSRRGEKDMVDDDDLTNRSRKHSEISAQDDKVGKNVNEHHRLKAQTDEKGLQRAAEKEKDKLSSGNLAAGDANAEKSQGRSGGVYIPPFKLAQMMKDIQDKSSVEYQRMTWDALRKSINGLVNKVNASNIKNIIPELLSENLIRGRGLFSRSCMKSQMASPTFTHVFAALVAVVNTKFPELGELLLKRIILQFRRALKRNDKPLLLAAAKFIAHLVNQQVAHEVVALEVLMVLLENPTDDSVEVAVGFVKECGAILQDLAPQGLHGIFERFRGILHEGEIDKRVQFMIEGLFAIRKASFQGHQAVLPELDLVEQEDQFTHEISLSDDLDAEMSLDIFKPDQNFLENEKKYEGIKKDILGEESSDDDDDGEKDSGLSSEDDDEDDEEDEAEMQRMQIKDETETNLVNLRRTIYLTIMSSVDFEEAGHKLLKIKLEPGQEMELNIMLLECCSQERTYLRYYGLLGQRFCMINKVYQENFDECFVKQYSMIHRLETNKLRNVAKFFAHLLGTDALPWNVLAYIRLTEEDTTSSSRIFIKILFQELSEHLGLRKLNEKLNDPMMQDSFDGIFPKDNPKNTRFAINFFTSIGLGGITDNLREYLKNMPRLIMQQQRQVENESESSDSDDISETETSSSESDSESSSSESESESESDSERKRRRK